MDSCLICNQVEVAKIMPLAMSMYQKPLQLLSSGNPDYTASNNLFWWPVQRTRERIFEEKQKHLSMGCMPPALLVSTI